MRSHRKNFLCRRRNILCLVAALLAVTSIAKGQPPGARDDDPRIERVIHGLRPPNAIKGQPPIRRSLVEWMASNHVPGVSIAVIDNGKIAWARGFGVKAAGASDQVTPSTLFEAQSISKAVTATAALSLVSSGRLSLDTPVNAYLKSWTIPDNAFQAQEKVTLRRILSHSAGLTVGSFMGYRLGDPLPGLVQILDGEKPANSPPIRVDSTPGSMFRYSGGGMEVLQQLLMDVSGQPFPELMRQLVLTPSGMGLSTYQQPLPEARWHEAASGHDSNGDVVTGKWPIQPEMAAAGLWTTPTDLARWVLKITNAWKGDDNQLLSKHIATDMLTVQKAPYGLGVEVQGAGATLEFSHAGSNTGFRAMVIMFPAVGKGAVIMTNGDKGDSIIANLIPSIASEYRWPARTQTERAVIQLSHAQLDALVGVYSLPDGPSGEPVTFEVTRTDDKLYGQLKGLGPRPKSTLFPSSPSSFFTLGGMVVDFVLDSSGRAASLKFGSFVGLRKP